MQLIFDNLNELNDIIVAMGYVKGYAKCTAPAGKNVKPPAKKKATPAAAAEAAEEIIPEKFIEPAPVQTKPTKTEPVFHADGTKVKHEEPASLEADKTEPAVTATDILVFVKAEFSDNIQPVKDMLNSVGAKKISEIPKNKMAAAMEMLHKAVA